MKAADVMTRNLVSVPPDATVADAVKTMLDRGVSGLFVVDSAGELAGVLTEGDLMRREELGTRAAPPLVAADAGLAGAPGGRLHPCA